MKKAIVTLEGLAPYSQSRFHNTEKLNKEGAGDYEKRTWIEKAHWDDEGRLTMPALAFKNAIAEAAKYLSEQIPGKGKATYTKHFEAGISVLENSLVSIKGKTVTRENIVGDTLHVPSDGRRGGGSRVLRTFPTIGKGWTATIEFLIFDDIITEDVFSRTLLQAGQLIGIGSFRVRNNGTRGRFKPTAIEWKEDCSF